MDNTKSYGAKLNQSQSQPAVDDNDENEHSDRTTEYMVRYVRHVGKLNQANRQMITGIERSKFSPKS